MRLGSKRPSFNMLLWCSKQLNWLLTTKSLQGITTKSEAGLWDDNHNWSALRRFYNAFHLTLALSSTTELCMITPNEHHPPFPLHLTLNRSWFAYHYVLLPTWLCPPLHSPSPTSWLRLGRILYFAPFLAASQTPRRLILQVELGEHHQSELRR